MSASSRPVCLDHILSSNSQESITPTNNPFSIYFYDSGLQHRSWLQRSYAGCKWRCCWQMPVPLTPYTPPSGARKQPTPHHWTRPPRKEGWRIEELPIVRDRFAICIFISLGKTCQKHPHRNTNVDRFTKDTQSKLKMFQMTECAWEFENNALWECCWHAMLVFNLLFSMLHQLLFLLHVMCNFWSVRHRFLSYVWIYILLLDTGGLLHHPLS